MKKIMKGFVESTKIPEIIENEFVYHICFPNGDYIIHKKENGKKEWMHTANPPKKVRITVEVEA